MKSPLLTAALVLGAACGSPGDPAESHPFRVSASGDTLQLVNVSHERVFYFIYEREAAALINWGPCVDKPLCSSLDPGAQASVPYSTIGGYAAGRTEAIVWWWHAMPGPGDSLVPSRIEAIVVRL